MPGPAAPSAGGVSEVDVEPETGVPSVAGGGSGGGVVVVVAVAVEVAVEVEVGVEVGVEVEVEGAPVSTPHVRGGCARARAGAETATSARRSGRWRTRLAILTQVWKAPRPTVPTASQAMPGAGQRQFFGASGCLSGAAFWNASSRIAAS
jgi:hypothetical protein